VYVGEALNPGVNVVGYHEQPGIGAAPAVPTDPPALKATSPAANIPVALNDSQQTQDVSRGISRAVIIDPQTNILVFQSLDARTGDVIEQVPAPALLRRLAYEGVQALHAVIQGEDPNAAIQKIDITT
jgi:hypothetical protein